MGSTKKIFNNVLGKTVDNTLEKTVDITKEFMSPVVSPIINNNSNNESSINTDSDLLIKEAAKRRKLALQLQRGYTSTIKGNSSESQSMQLLKPVIQNLKTNLGQ